MTTGDSVRSVRIYNILWFLIAPLFFMSTPQSQPNSTKLMYNSLGTTHPPPPPPTATLTLLSQNPVHVIAKGTNNYFPGDRVTTNMKKSQCNNFLSVTKFVASTQLFFFMVILFYTQQTRLLNKQIFGLYFFYFL